eukprot:1139524-Pelagomonas_calceolata.AAC.19
MCGCKPPKSNTKETYPFLNVPASRRYFNEEIQGINQSLLAATIQIYNTIRNEMLPTPSKSHYTFNLRDLSKVVQGCMRADPKSTSDKKQILSLWLHECSRVFEDRLNNQADHDWFRKQQVMLLDQHFRLGYEDIVPQGRLIYGDFLIPGRGHDATCKALLCLVCLILKPIVEISRMHVKCRDL